MCVCVRACVRASVRMYVCMDTRLIDCGDLKTRVRICFIVLQHYGDQDRNINYVVGT